MYEAVSCPPFSLDSYTDTMVKDISQMDTKDCGINQPSFMVQNLPRTVDILLIKKSPAFIELKSSSLSSRKYTTEINSELVKSQSSVIVF
jgi:hypothetical protein